MLNDRRRAFAACCIVVLTILTRLPALLHPHPIDDEGVYSVVANEMVDGGRLYIDVVERKPPLLFALYAGIFEVAGKSNWLALHLVALVWTLGTMAGLYCISARLFNRDAGLIAALLYSIFQPWGTYKNLALNGELLMNLPIVLAWATAFRSSRSRYRPELLLCGALSCIAFLLKQPAAIAAVPLGVYLLLPSYRAARGLTQGDSIAQAALLTIGFFATLALSIAVLWSQGILRPAFFWVISNHTDLSPFWLKAGLHTLAFVATCLPLLIGAAAAIKGRALWLGKSAERASLLMLLAASAIGAAAGGRFYPHYYIQFVPALVLLASAFYENAWSVGKNGVPWLLRPTAMRAWLGVTVVGFVIAHSVSLGRLPRGTQAGRYIAAHAQPGDRVFVWGHDFQVYLDSHCRPASRFVGTFPLTGSLYAGPHHIDTRDRIRQEDWDTLQSEFDRHPPAFIVDLEVDPGADKPARNFPVLARLLETRYHPIARTEEGLIYARR